jgi:uncharacterized protein
MAAPVSDDMKGLIRAELDRIAREEDVSILFAIESGSRAWGFHSTDSDYDVRFVYARPPDWFLRLDDRRDVIERPISGDLDISGWELGKALKLALKSNAVLSEWLQSPIRYSDVPEARQILMDFCRSALTRRPVTWHYLSIAEQQRTGLTSQNGIKLKRYFYVLRPVMALRWMRLHDAATPPMNLWEMIAAAKVPAEIESYLRDLVKVKLETGEMGFAEKTDPAADAFIEAELQVTRDWLAQQADHQPTDLWAAANRLHVEMTRRFA